MNLLGRAISGRTSDVPLPEFLCALSLLFLMLVGLWGIAPRRPVAPADSAQRARLSAPDVVPATRPLLDALGAGSPETWPEHAEDADAVAALGPAVVGRPSVERAVSQSATLLDLAREYEVDAGALATYNGLSADVVQEPIGRAVLTLPGGAIEGGGLKLTLDSPAPHPDRTLNYMIAEGDTLLAIALRLGIDPGDLAGANGLQSVDLIRAGEQLEIAPWENPATVRQPALAPPPPEIAAAAPTRPPEPTKYEVSAGDTVSTLAERFGVDTETIVGANSLSSPDQIRIGDQLTILPVLGVMHAVRAGQTLSEIAALYKVDLGPIIDFNYLDDADLIGVGKELIIPGGRPLQTVPPAPPSREYRVAPGDTLTGIAARFGVSPASVAQASGLANPDRLILGATLAIPGATAVTTQQVVTRNLSVFTPAANSNVPVPSSGGLGSSIVSIAMRYRGASYVWGGTSPSGFDCSGFVYYVMTQGGKPISRGLWGQYNAGPHPAKGDLQPGDLVFFQNTYMPGLSHNGIYIGGGKFINAVDEASGVTISSIDSPYWSSRWFGATRVP